MVTTLVVLSTENEGKVSPVQLPSIRQGHDALLIGGDIVTVQILYRTQTACGPVTFGSEVTMPSEKM